MSRRQNSLFHRSGKLLCNDIGIRTQSINSSNSSGHVFDSQPLQLPGAGANDVFLAPEMDFQRMSHPMQAFVPGYYAAQPLACSLPRSHQYTYHLPRSGIDPPAGIYDAYALASQPFGTPADFEGVYYNPLAAQAPQPPTPPAAPEMNIALNPSFHYHPCFWFGGPRCDGLAPGKNREMAEHLRVCHHFIGHERDTVQCQWEHCGQVMQRMNVARHVVSRHLLAAANCRICGRRFSRPDVVARHERTCGGVLST